MMSKAWTSMPSPTVTPSTPISRRNYNNIATNSIIRIEKNVKKKKEKNPTENTFDVFTHI